MRGPTMRRPRRRISVGLVAVASAAVLGSGAASALAQGQPKITICHKTGSATNPEVTITVAAASWKAHAAHGDTQGACPASTPGNGPYEENGNGPYEENGNGPYEENGNGLNGNGTPPGDTAGIEGTQAEEGDVAGVQGEGGTQGAEGTQAAEQSPAGQVAPAAGAGGPPNGGAGVAATKAAELSAARGGGDELAFTGLDAPMVALMGMAMAALGYGMRRGMRSPA